MDIRNVLKIVIILSTTLISIPNGWAQRDEATQKLTEEKKQLSYEDTIALLETEKKEVEKEENFIFNYGGWLTFTNTHYKNLDNDAGLEDWVKGDFYLDMRFWLNVIYYQLLSLYGRIQDYYVWRPKVASDYTGIGDDNRGPLVDILYTNLDFHGTGDLPLSISIGRQFLTLGRGITYGDVHDGIQFECSIGRYVSLKGFMSKTKPYEDNIDYSVPGYDKKGSNRHFYGLEIGGSSGRTIVIYSYVLVQMDLSHEYPEEMTQNYTYNSEHIGIGLSGEPSNHFSYWGELIKEYGSSYTDATMTQLAVKGVDAWAFDVGAKYRFGLYSHPALEGEIAYGSGDKERTRVTNTVGGNVSGKDKNFLYFGAYEAGYALYPRLSNMFIYKIGMSFKPFEIVPYVGDNIALGLKFYIYRKDQKSGGIYDVEATAADEDVGQEINFFTHYKIYENLYFTLRYGVFFPGAAYPKGTRHNSEYLYLRTRFIF